MIPEDAVESAAKALALGGFYSEKEWNEITLDKKKEPFRKHARIALEAAAPLLMEQAWNEGFDVGKDDDNWGDGAKAWDNPYRDPTVCPSRIPAAPHSFEWPGGKVARDNCYYCGMPKEGWKA